ncbi:DUF421 domain-containing protein [Caulobacter sp.]|uniref:DUF421 domain-containing protein n=1 Tax=Caulobacter sp. TaxID=78 RepID=UPI002B489CEC|nr:YetF domain-containing protein [Caulobacter sp.]HJV40535.1 YetF domain-containing protein [Caulobacter sp.]
METLRILIGPDTGDATVAQLCARAVILFLFGVVCIRIAGRRTFSQITPLDIIVAIIVGSNLSRAMTGKAPFFGGLAATLVVVVLHRLIAMATLRWSALTQLFKGAPVRLVQDGIVDRPAMRRHAISQADLEEGLRMEQVEAIEDVRLATLEAGGKISVVRRRDVR